MSKNNKIRRCSFVVVTRANKCTIKNCLHLTTKNYSYGRNRTIPHHRCSFSHYPWHCLYNDEWLFGWNEKNVHGRVQTQERRNKNCKSRHNCTTTHTGI